MKVNGQTVQSINIEGESGVCISITETPKGNLRLTEIGQYIKTIQIIPQSSNSIVIKSTREAY